MKRLDIRSIDRRTALVVFAVLVLLALIAWKAREVVELRQLDADAAEVMAIAEEQVIDLTTLDAQTVDARIEDMGARSTGDFKRQLDGIASTFVTVVQDQQVDATGTIDAAGLVKIDDTSAEVIVASTSSVLNAEGAEPVVRTYRMSVVFERVDGAWLISGMEFVS